MQVLPCITSLSLTSHLHNTPEGTLPRRFTMHSGAVIPLDKRCNPNATFSPNILFMLQDKFTQINLGFYVNKGPLVGGFMVPPVGRLLWLI